MSAFAPLSQAMQDVLDERRRQIAREGFTPAHDDQHYRGELCRAAAAYAYAASVPDFDRPQLKRPDTLIGGIVKNLWPRQWGAEWFKLKTRRQDKVRAAALLIADIEREDRQAVLDKARAS